MAIPIIPIIKGAFGDQFVPLTYTPKTERTQEQREADRRADRLDTAGVLRLFRWTPAQLEAAKLLGLPEAQMQPIANGGAGWIRSKAACMDWAARLKSCAQTLPR